MTTRGRSENILNGLLLVTLITLTSLVTAASFHVAAIRVQNPGLSAYLVFNGEPNPVVIQGINGHYVGTGFYPSGTVDVSIDLGYGQPLSHLPSTHADTTGGIDDQFTTNDTFLPGTRQLTFNDTSTNEIATAIVIILAPVQFLTNPTSFPGYVSGNISSTNCGGLVGGKTSYACGASFPAVAILPKPSSGWNFDHWETFGNTTDIIPGFGVSCFPLTNTNSTTCSSYSSGALKADFSVAVTVLTDPGYVGSVSFGSCTGTKYTNGTIAWRPELPPEYTGVSVCANPSYGFTFIDWTATGGIAITNNLSPQTTLQLSGPGTLTAHYEVQITLQSGWNLISLPLVPSDTSIGDLLKPLVIKNEVVSVWTYTNTPRVWQYYVPGKSSTLSTMVDGNGYWLYMTSADKLNLTGTVIPSSHIPPTYPLVAGWNLLGFKPQPVITNDTVSQYLGGISGKYDPNNVWVYDSLSTNWIRTDPSYVLHPGQAIWILMNSPASFEP